MVQVIFGIALCIPQPSYCNGTVSGDFTSSQQPVKQELNWFKMILPVQAEDEQFAIDYVTVCDVMECGQMAIREYSV